jgi:hypothetical protein
MRRFEEPDDEQLEHREEREVELQHVLDALAAECAGRPLPDVVAELERRLAAHGFPPQPARWVDAAASAAARGERYVVSVVADRDTQAPPGAGERGPH